MKSISKRFAQIIPLKPRNHFFQRFLISYLLVLIVPLCAFPLFFHYSYDKVLEQERNIRSLQVAQSAENMDNALIQINQFFLTLEQNTDLSKILYMKERPKSGSADAWQLYKAQREMTILREYNRINYNFSIFFKNSDLVFCNTSFIYGIERFYSIHTYYEGMDYEAFCEKVLNTPYGKSVLPDIQLVHLPVEMKRSPDSYARTDGILYLISLPIINGSTSNNCGVAAVHLSTDLFGVLNYIPVSAHGYTWIEDVDHNLIYEIPGSQYSGEHPLLSLSDESGSFIQTLNGKKCLVTYITSDYNGWRYVSISPIRELTSSLLFIRNVFYAIYVLVIIAGLVLCFYMTHKNSAPIRNLLTSIHGDDPELASLNSFAALETYIKDTLSDNHKFNGLLTEQEKRLNQNFYDRLLDGQFADRTEFDLAAEYLDIHLDAKMYGFLLICFGDMENEDDDFTEQNLSHVYAELLDIPNLHFHMHTHFLSMNQLGIFLLFPENDISKNRKLLKEEFEPAFYDAFHQLSIDVRCSSGRFYTDPLNLSLACNEARLTMAQTADLPPQYAISFYEDVPPEPAFYYYPAAIETKLKGLINARNMAGINELLDIIFEENLEKRNLPDHVLESLFLDMRIGIIRILRELKLSIPVNLFPAVHKTRNPSRECEQIRTLYNQLVDSLNPLPPENDMPARIADWLEAHYSDCTISVVTVADAFHMSASYFSTYFKKQMDVTFSKYLETLRINKACEMIKNTDLNIEAISAQVGYSSSLSFRRAFKKVMGIPPTSYR